MRRTSNVGAATVEETSAELQDIDAAVSRVPVRGARYSADRQKLVGR